RTAGEQPACHGARVAAPDAFDPRRRSQKSFALGDIHDGNSATTHADRVPRSLPVAVSRARDSLRPAKAWITFSARVSERHRLFAQARPHPDIFPRRILLAVGPPPIIALLPKRHSENGGHRVVGGQRVAGNTYVDRRLRHVETERPMQPVPPRKYGRP